MVQGEAARAADCESIVKGGKRMEKDREILGLLLRMSEEVRELSHLTKWLIALSVVLSASNFIILQILK